MREIERLEKRERERWGERGGGERERGKEGNVLWLYGIR